jgi:preprotein translocase subunit SecD
MDLDGKPLASVRPSALYNGILVNFPVTVTVASPTGPRDVVGRMELPYRPRLLKAVESRLADKNADTATIAGYYAEEARKEIEDPAAREKVRESLTRIYSKSNVDELRKTPERVLRGASVLINEQQIVKADSEEVDLGEQKRYDINLQLTDEGRKRLHKYSMDKVGTYVMLIVDGVAVAAPKISHQLTQDELTISGSQDKVLVREAVDAMNKVVKKD